MKVYIASSHKTAYETTNSLFCKTKNNNEIDFFFPETIGDMSDSPENMEYIDFICCDKLRKSDVLVAVYPFGFSVSVEIGRFLEYSNIYSDKKRYFIVLDTSYVDSDDYKKLRTEAMILPHIDYIANNIDELLDILKQL